MFTGFFFLLRDYGLRISTKEWNGFLQGLEAGLHHSSLSGFYALARAVLVHTEADYDRFDRAFLACFKDVETGRALPPELEKWLSEPLDNYRLPDNPGLDIEEIRRMFELRLREQTERHDGGTHWVGTGGASPFGNSGNYPGGLRVGGEGRNRSALQVAAERNYRDFRDDTVLQVRQFQMAFRRLRQFTALDTGPKDELQLEKTIRKTGENAGQLQLVFDRPRRNAVKLLMLFDSGGSMWDYTKLCASLFKAVSRESKFKDLKIYYFHNCVYDNLYKDPGCSAMTALPTDWVLNNLAGDYKVIFVGDASMAPYELLSPGGCSDYYCYNKEPGIDWLRRLHARYEKSVWLNPMEERRWTKGYGSETVRMIMEEFPMYPLTVRGLQDGLKRLLADR